MKREKATGITKSPCPLCGRDLAVLNLPDGGVTTEGCRHCFPAHGAEVAASQGQGQGLGQEVREGSHGPHGDRFKGRRETGVDTPPADGPPVDVPAKDKKEKP